MKEYCSKAEIYADLQDQLETLKNLRDILSETTRSIYNITDACTNCIDAGLALGADIDFNLIDLRVILTVGKGAYNAAEALKQFVNLFDNSITVSQETVNRINRQ